MKRLILLIFIIQTLSVAGQKLGPFDKVICPVYKIPNSTTAPIPATDMLYALSDNLIWGGLSITANGIVFSAGPNGKNSVLGKGAYPSGTGYSNISIGANSLKTATSAKRNVAVGDSALGNLTTGSGNVAIGFKAGRVNANLTANQTSENGTFIGKLATAQAAGDTNETVIGHMAKGNGSSTTTIGNTNTVATYLMGTLTVGSTPDDAAPTYVTTIKSGKFYRTPVSNFTGDTTQYANVIKWGADKNGWVSSTAAFQAAINSGKPVVIPDGNFLIDSVTLLDNTIIIGNGVGHSNLILASGKRVLFKISGKNYISITGVSLIGGNYSWNWSSSMGNRVGIEIINSGYVSIEKSKIFGFTAYGVRSVGTDINMTFFHRVTNVETPYNYIGFQIESNSEYGSYVALNADNCKYALRLYGGNNKFTNCSWGNSPIAFYQGYAPNNGHGSVVGCSFNHCTRYGVFIDSVVVKGMVFEGCQQHNGGFLIKNSGNIQFTGCNMMADSLRFSGTCSRSGFKGCFINESAMSSFYRAPATDGTICTGNLWSSGSTSNLAYINDSWTMAGQNVIYPGTGNVGIKNTSPTETVSVGSASAGGTMKVYATVGTEMFTSFAAGNWTFTTGWENTNLGGTKIRHMGTDGTGAITLKTVAAVIGTTYRVIIVVDSCTVGGGNLYFGNSVSQVFQSAGTYIFDLTAASVSGLNIYPFTTVSRFTINSISIKALTDGTGDVTIGGNLKVSSPIQSTRGIDAITVLPNGNVGIMKNNPQYSLHTSGAFMADASVMASGGNATFSATVCKGATDGVWIVGNGYNSSNSAMSFQTKNTEVGRFDATGRLGINTPNPQYTTDVNGIVNAKGFRRVSTDTTGYGSTTNVGLEMFFDGHLYLLVAGSPRPTWVLVK